MLKKVIGFNGSPRKGWNTDMMVQKVLEGARDAGATTKLYQLNDLKIKSCQSCLVCKKSPKTAGHCIIKDDLAPILDEIKTADALVIGSPIYYGLPSSLVHTTLERLWFSNYRYTKEQTAFPRHTKTAMIYTMNIDEERAKLVNYPMLFDLIKKFNEVVFRAPSQTLCAYNTVQVSDYSKYDIKTFNIPQKLQRRKEIFPQELQKAYELGRSLVTSE